MSGGQPCRLADIRGLSQAKAARKESVSSGVELGTSLWSCRPRFSVAFPKKMQHCAVIISLFHQILYEPVHEKTNNLGFRPGLTQTRLHSHTIKLEA